LDTLSLIWNVQRAGSVAKNQALECSNGIHDDVLNIVISDLFCSWFLTDFSLRTILGGRSVLQQNWVWFFLDFLVVVAYILEVIAHHARPHQRSYSSFRALVSELAVVRVLRLLQLGNMSQVVRHNIAFRELRLMLYALQGMLKSLLWSSVIVFVILIIFGVILTEASLAFCVTNRALLEDYTSQLRHNFGELSRSMLILFQAMSNGADWGQVYDSLGPLPWVYKLIFIFFQAFTFLALMNVVTSVFVESTMQRSLMDRESVVVDEMSARKEFLNSIGSLFNEFDQDGDGTIDFEDMREQFQKPAVRVYFASLGVDANQIGRLFELLDRDKSGTIDREEFMFGCQHLKGEAKSLDMAIIRSDLQVMFQGILDVADTLDACVLMVNRAFNAAGRKRTKSKN